MELNTLELPKPGSVWRYRSTNFQTRVTHSTAAEILAHNCEEDKGHPMVSWRGDIHDFHATFIPGNPEKYPATAR